MAQLQHTLLKYSEDLNNLGTVTAHTLVTKDYVDSQVGTNTTSTDHIPYWTGSGWASSPLDIDFATNAVHQPNGTFVIGAATAPTHEIFKIESSIYSANVASFGDITPITMTAVTGSNAIGFNARKNSTSDWVMYSTGGGGSEYGGFIQYNAINGRFTIQGAPTALGGAGNALNQDVFFQTYPNGDVFINQYGTGTKTSVGNEAYYLAVNSSGQIIESTIDEIADLPTTTSIDNAADWIPFYDSSDVVDRRINVNNILESGFTGQGVVTKLASGFAYRTLVGDTNEIAVSNGDGLLGNPTIGIATDPILPGSGGVTLPSGTTASRPGAPNAFELRGNTTNTELEYWDGSAWISVGTGSGDNLGNHLATQNLDMDNNDIIDVDLIQFFPGATNNWRVRAGDFDSLIFDYNGFASTVVFEISGAISINDPSVSGYTFPAADGTANQILETDGSGTLTWVDPPSGGDDLGNHTASQDLNMLGYNINNVDRLRFYGSLGFWDIIGDAASPNLTISLSTGGELIRLNGSGETITFHDEYTFPTADGAANRVLTTDGSGTLTWEDANTLTNANTEFATITAATTIDSTNEDTYAGKFVRVTGGTYTITLDDSVENGKQFFFFYESGTGTITFAGGGTAGTLSKDNHTKINAVGMAVTVTKLPVGDDFALVGDLVA
jgi:hypothetical protein